MSAPGCSAFNEIERRMAPLSKALVGLVISHEILGSHLDSNNNTVNDELERNNFAAAGGILAKVWNELIIDKYKTKAAFIEPTERKQKEGGYDELDWKWIDKHVHFGHYHLSMLKCTDINCER